MQPKKDIEYEGPITIIKTGKGFFTFDPNEEDMFISGENLGGAFPGDIVKVQFIGNDTDKRTGKARPAGKVVEVVSRARETFVGKLVENKEENLIMMIPDWKKMYVPFVVKGESLPLGHKVVIRFKGWNQHQPYPWGELEEIIGPAGEHETEMRALALSQGFRSDFPPGVQTEAKYLEEHGRQMLKDGADEGIAAGTRKDFRGTTTFTIDPFDAKDFDDALSVKTLPNGNYEIGVHIADVSHFVRPGTQIDNEARKRATSVYLVDRTIPMLPHILSTDLCSLNPNEDRLSMSAVFELDKEAGIVSRWFGPTVIHSDKRFTYEEAQEVLTTQNGIMLEELNILKMLADKIRARRVARGAIAFDTPEVKVILDENGKPVDIVAKERIDTMLVIEDFMLLANEAVAEFLSTEVKKTKTQSIYRVHDKPDAALRSMAKAVYTTKNAGHFGLAFEFYTHFTSPIRRYPDLLIHRLVKRYTVEGVFSKEELAELDILAIHSSEREVAAVEAERDSIKMKQVEYMSEHIGEEFDAVISGVSDRGLYVELKESRAEGMIRVRDIGDDYFIYDEKRYRLVGEKSKTEYALGDPIRVKLMDARLAERELDFQIVKA